MEPVDVALLGRRSIVREGLSRILSEHDFRITQSVRSADSFESSIIQRNNGHLLILIDSDDNQDLEVVSSLHQRFPAAYPVFLSNDFNFDAMVVAFKNGAHGYIVKEISCDPLIGALKLIAMGEKVLPSQLADDLSFYLAAPCGSEGETFTNTANLSDRELEIVRCLIMGCPNKVISRRLDISEATVKVHVKAVLRKLGVHNRTQAAIWAASNGIRGLNIEETWAARPVNRDSVAPAFPALAHPVPTGVPEYSSTEACAAGV